MLEELGTEFFDSFGLYAAEGNDDVVCLDLAVCGITFGNGGDINSVNLGSYDYTDCNLSFNALINGSALEPAQAERVYPRP